MHKIVLFAPALLLCGCQTVVNTPPADCSSFIPAGWKTPIEGASLPADDTLPEWMKFGLGQSGQLSKANGRHADTLHIFGECERRQNDARPRKKLLGIF